MLLLFYERDQGKMDENKVSQMTSREYNRIYWLFLTEGMNWNS